MYRREFLVQVRIQGDGFGTRPSSGQRTGRGEGVEGDYSWGGVEWGTVSPGASSQQVGAPNLLSGGPINCVLGPGVLPKGEQWALCKQHGKQRGSLWKPNARAQAGLILAPGRRWGEQRRAWPWEVPPIALLLM